MNHVKLDALGDWRRTHTCGQLRAAQVGETVTLMGWLHRSRDHGGVLFVDLRDRFGLTQIVFHPETGGREQLERASHIGHEWVIAIRGILNRRPDESLNPDLPTGEVEVDVRELRVLSTAENLPFQVNEELHLAGEDIRLQYRFLDLRRPEISNVLALRHRATMSMRRYLSSRDFLEVETPILVKTTPEGARDYVVPSRLKHGEFFSLPQSPQLYKQTLMISGVDRYFQLARCLRDEDLRADRQPEHTQLDLEMSFADETDVYDVVEGVFQTLWKECLDVDLPESFPRMTFNEAMLRFGSDKPDTRFGLEFVECGDVLSKSPRNVVANGPKAEGGVGVALVIPGGSEISGTQLRKYEDVVKAAGGGGLSFFKVLPGERAKQEKIFPGELLDEFFNKVGAREGDAVLFTGGPWEKTLHALGVLRTQLGKPLVENMQDTWNFLWVRDFPLFEFDPDTNRWAPRHHMFTMPNPEHMDLLESDPGKVHAQLYDLVLNGHELGSGSVRIHRPDIQEQVMKVVGFTQEELKEKFGFLIDAYRYGSPPHGGIGIGLDRVVMLMAGRETIRDTIAFPKSASAACLMDGSPSPLDKQTLKDLGLKVLG